LLQTAAGAFVVVKSLDWRRWSRPVNVAKTRGRLRNAGVACGCVLSQGKTSLDHTITVMIMLKEGSVARYPPLYAGWRQVYTH